MQEYTDWEQSGKDPAESNSQKWNGMGWNFFFFIVFGNFPP